MTATHDPSVTTSNDAPTISQTTTNNATEGSASTNTVIGVFDVDDEETADGDLNVSISNSDNYYVLTYDNAGTATVKLSSAGVTAVNAGTDLSSYTVTVTDDDSTPRSVTATHDPSVTTSNDAPVADNETNTITEGNNLNVVDGSSGDVLVGDTDTDNDGLSVVSIRTGAIEGSGTAGAVGLSLAGTYGSLTIRGNGSYKYVPNDVLGASETGVDSFNYTVSDGNGGTDIGILRITVTGTNDAPIAINDKNTIDISSNLTLRAINGSVDDVLTNDRDPDTSATITVTEIRTGRVEGSGTSGTVGASLTGTYGSLTINQNGSYTFNVNEGLKDSLDPGEIVFENFNYTVSDGTVTDTGSLVIKLQNGSRVITELRDKDAEVLPIEERKRNEEPIRSVLELPKVTNNLELNFNKLEIPKQDKKTIFSQGLRLADLEAFNIDTINKDGLTLSFKILNDTDIKIIKYDATMKDGSKLPDWIKINSKTGVTKTTIPDGIDNVEIIVTATDNQNNKRQITVKIDPKEILEDNEIIKNVKSQNNNIKVDENGNVNLIKNDQNGAVDEISTKNLNLNNEANLKNIIKNIKPDITYQLQPIKVGNNFVIDIPSEIIGNFETSKLVQDDGTKVPEWVKFNSETKEITAIPPNDVSQLELKLVIEVNGEILVKEIKLEFNNTDNTKLYDKDNLKFVSLQDQLNREYDNWNDYGGDIINKL